MKNYGTPVTYLNMSLGTRKLLQLNIRLHPRFIQLKSCLEDRGRTVDIIFTTAQRKLKYILVIDRYRFVDKTLSNIWYICKSSGYFLFIFSLRDEGVQVTSNIKAFKYTPRCFVFWPTVHKLRFLKKKTKICTFVKFVKDTTPRIWDLFK